MRCLFATVAVLALAHAPLSAQACEATFNKSGNPVTGLRFTATHTVEKVTKADAIDQLRGVVLERGYDVLASEPEAGSLLMEVPQTADRRSYQMVAQATADGAMMTIQLKATLRGGVFAKQETARTEMCAMLAGIQGGSAGVAAAARGRSAKAGGGAPTVLTAQTLADRLSAERDNNVNAIPLRYRDRSFTLSGTVASVDRDGDTYRVRFDILSWDQKAIKVPGESRSKTDIVCVLAPGQSVYALTLKPRSSVRLTGTYSDYIEVPSPSVMWLSNCRPAS